MRSGAFHGELSGPDSWRIGPIWYAPRIVTAELSVGCGALDRGDLHATNSLERGTGRRASNLRPTCDPVIHVNSDLSWVVLRCKL